MGKTAILAATPQKAWTGQPAADHRHIVNGILWLHRMGAPWRDIPAEH